MSKETQITLISGLEPEIVRDAEASKSKSPIQVKLSPKSWDYQCAEMIAKILDVTRTEAVRIAIRATYTTLLRQGGRGNDE